MLSGVAEKLGKIRSERMARVLVGTLDHLDEDLDRFPERLGDDPRRIALVSKAVAIASLATTEAKIDALAHLVAEGVDDDAKLDENDLLLNILADIEVPHVTTLLTLATVFDPNIRMCRSLKDGELHEARFFTYGELRTELPRFGQGISAIVATLERHGLIMKAEVDLSELLRDFEAQLVSCLNTNTPPHYFNHKNEGPGWRITELGLSLLALLKARVDGEALVSETGGPV